MRRWFGTLAILALITTIPARGQTSSAKANPKSGAVASADMPLIDLSGYHRVLAGYRGKPLLVTFWATWCEPCRDEFPTLIQLAEHYTPQGLAVFGVSLDDNADMNLVRHFLAQFKPQFPNYRQKPQIDVDEFYRGVNPSWQGTMPETIFYGRDGHIVRSFTAEQTRATFEDAIHEILTVHSSGNHFVPAPPRGN